MTIEKLPSGSYRIREMRNGKSYSVTVKEKPTKAEARALLEKKTAFPSTHLSVEKAAACYIDARRGVISPTTATGYKSIIRSTSPAFLGLYVDDVSVPVVQKLISEYSAGHSAKTTANFGGFWLSVLRFYGNDLKPPRLPQKSSKRVYIPTEAEVMAILAETKGTEFEVPLFLACFGLRRSEICALKLSDLSDDNVLTVDKALVLDENRQWIVKQTKTPASVRQVLLPAQIADRIREQGCVYDRHPEYLLRELKKIQRKLGIQPFPLHKLRHFFASYLHNLGYTDKQIQEMGGWSTDRTLRQVYQHAMEMDDVRRNVADRFGSLI